MTPKKSAPAIQPYVRDVVAAVHQIAPFQLAEEWDNVGLQFGDPAKPAGKIMVALEATTAVVAEAVKKGVGTLVTHHPVYLRAPKKFNEANCVAALAAKIIRANLAVVVAHTNLDSVAHGTNGELADRLGLQTQGRRFLNPVKPQPVNAKVVVYVPTEAIEAVFEAVTAAGAAAHGNYSHATYRSLGTSTFKPLEGANPARGKVGKLEMVEEFRLEFLAPRALVPRVLRAMQQAHPYEVPAFDVYPVDSPEEPTAGLGLVGTLMKPTTLEGLVKVCKKTLDIRSVGVVGDLKIPLETVAISTGSGGEFVREWHPGTADVFVTGEMNHHDCLEAAEKGLPVLLVGHWASEAIVSERFAGLIGQTLAEQGFPGIEPVVAKAQENPLQRV